MSEAFFTQLAIARPDHVLGVGSKPHGAQTAEMMIGLDAVMSANPPDWVLLYGDTNSTAAGALVAAKIAGVRVAHVEAGLRSFNRAMPEELNRIITDHLSDLLHCPTAAAMENATKEGLGGKAIVTGDVMLDAVLEFARVAESQPHEGLEELPERFALATLHRAENTDNMSRLLAILEGLERVAGSIAPVILPLHPRTRKVLQEAAWTPRAVTIIKPVPYLAMLLLEQRASFILTDSGGVQKEAYFFQKPAITLREETEWVETLENGCNRLTPADPAEIVNAALASSQAGPWKPLYGNGDAAVKICRSLLD